VVDLQFQRKNRFSSNYGSFERQVTYQKVGAVSYGIVETCYRTLLYLILYLKSWSCYRWVWEQLSESGSLSAVVLWCLIGDWGCCPVLLLTFVDTILLHLHKGDGVMYHNGLFRKLPFVLIFVSLFRRWDLMEGLGREMWSTLSQCVRANPDDLKPSDESTKPKSNKHRRGARSQKGKS
jgi:hypothetical protein